MSVRNLSTGKVIYETNYKASAMSDGVGQVSFTPAGGSYVSARTENGIVTVMLNDPMNQKKISVKSNAFTFSKNMTYLAASYRNDVSIIKYSEGCVMARLFDHEALSGMDAKVMEKKDETGEMSIRILPANGTDLQGYICTCNTVKGTGSNSPGGGGGGCSCVPVCTCVPVK
jgi:hypothetical protein